MKQEIEELYYLQDSRSVTGNCMMFWRKGSAGYSCNLDECALFTKEKAFGQHNVRETDVPILKSVIDNLSKRHVNIDDFHSLGRK